MIFWKHIKGLSATNIYTYIRFTEKSSTADASVNSLPHIYTSTTNTYDSDTAKDCGAILTTGVTGGYIDSSFTFNSAVTIGGTEFADDSGDLTISGESLTVSGKTTLSSTLDVSGKTTLSSTLAVTGATTLKGTLDVGGTANFTSYVAANYFNATSDYRAKKDFKPLTFSALDFVQKTPLYSFKYKDSNMPSIGIIAQDIQDINIDGFKLVDNENATGENFDYMSIHESKLVYILWKAIQEQQQEIAQLKEEIKNRK